MEVGGGMEMEKAGWLMMERVWQEKRLAGRSDAGNRIASSGVYHAAVRGSQAKIRQNTCKDGGWQMRCEMEIPCRGSLSEARRERGKCPAEAERQTSLSSGSEVK